MSTPLLIYPKGPVKLPGGAFTIPAGECIAISFLHPRPGASAYNTLSSGNDWVGERDYYARPLDDPQSIKVILARLTSTMPVDIWFWGVDLATRSDDWRDLACRAPAQARVERIGFDAALLCRVESIQDVPLRATNNFMFQGVHLVTVKRGGLDSAWLDEILCDQDMARRIYELVQAPVQPLPNAVMEAFVPGTDDFALLLIRVGKSLSLPQPAFLAEAFRRDCFVVRWSNEQIWAWNQGRRDTTERFAEVELVRWHEPGTSTKSS